MLTEIMNQEIDQLVKLANAVGNFQVEQSMSISALVTSLCKVQAELEGAKKDSVNPHFRSKYADLQSIWDACKPLLPNNGLAVIQTFRPCKDAVIIVTTLAHTSGEWIKGALELPLVKNDPQAVGSAVTYGRRYSLAAIVGVCPADDDAEAAQGRDAGYQHHNAAITEREEKRAEQARKAAPQRPAQAVNEDTGEEEREPGWMGVVLHFGKNKGVRLGDLEPKSLAWYANMSGDGWEPRPFRGRISDADRQLFDALNEYRVSQGKPARELPVEEREEVF